jgi:hypothetical protein
MSTNRAGYGAAGRRARRGRDNRDVRSFTCQNCGQLLFFENNLCLRCSSPLGFDPSSRELGVLAPPGTPDAQLTRCADAVLAACNWIPGAPGELCASCSLTRTRPNDADLDAEGLRAFSTAEGAKRWVLFGLRELGLPIGEALKFDLLSSRYGPVVTGHSDGVITIDLGESDDARRERRRSELGEPYRTVLGHFRHEIGHYYWMSLIDGGPALERFRELFGDDRADYQAALDRHYEHGPPADWEERYVSAYATMHPWEDWAETFAHYLHIRDTLQTAGAYGLIVAGPPRQPEPALVAAPGVADPDHAPFARLLEDWLPLTYSLNAINRSMGRDDLYPFTLAPAVVDKLAFVHEVVLGANGSGP